MKRFAFAVALALSTAIVPVGAADVPAAYVWDLTDLYSSPDAWAASQSKVKGEIAKLDTYKDSIGKSAGDMLTALKAVSATHKEVDRLYVYASLKADEDVRISENQIRK